MDNSFKNARVKRFIVYKSKIQRSSILLLSSKLQLLFKNLYLNKVFFFHKFSRGTSTFEKKIGGSYFRNIESFFVINCYLGNAYVLRWGKLF